MKEIKLNPSTLFDIPHSHKNDPITSCEAGDKMVDSGKLSYQAEMVFCAITSYLLANNSSDFTPKEIAGFSYISYFVIQRRMSDLQRAGLIERIAENGEAGNYKKYGWIPKIREGCCVWRLKKKI